MRGFYKLERRWKDAEVLDLGQVFGRAETQRDPLDEGTPLDDSIEDDPFWS